MRDHQLFEETVLPNGITLYTYQDHFRIACIEIQLPVGSGHSYEANNFLPGSVHFLEHVQMTRSQQFPEAYQLDQELGFLGGHGDAATYPTITSHWIDAPAQELNFVVDAVMDRVFRPLFHTHDLETERTVVINERNQRKYYPARSEASQYYYRDYINDVFYPLERIFGSDEDLQRMDVDTIAAMHSKIIRSPQTKVLAVGPHDFDRLKAQLSEIPTDSIEFKQDIQPTTWVRKEHSTIYFDEIAQPTLRVNWITPRMSYEEFQGMNFIMSLLTNATHGPLYHEFREEKGWLYSLDGFCTQREENTLIGFSFPVNKIEQADYIRECLHDRLVKALHNQTIVEHEILRYIRNQVYNYQTAGEIMSAASHDLMTYGRIYSEKEWLKTIQMMADTKWRTHLLETYLQPAEMGSICFMPERRRHVPVRDLPIVTQPRVATMDMDPRNFGSNAA